VCLGSNRSAQTFDGVNYEKCFWGYENMRYTDRERTYFVSQGSSFEEWNIFYFKNADKDLAYYRWRGVEAKWVLTREEAEKNLIKAAKRHKWLKVVENDECC
jgi:hypothetical protein